MEIKVLGPGCPKCKTLLKVTNEAVADLSLNVEIQKVEDIMEIMSFGAMHTPGLVINGKLVVSGRVPSASEIKELIEKNK